MDQKIWYYADGEEPLGVFSKHDLLHFRAMGRINDTTLIWCKGMKDWMPLESQFAPSQKITDEKPPLHVSNPDKTDPVLSETDGDQVGQKRTFFEAIRVCFKKAFVFSGRASRSEYWWFILFSILLGAVAGLIGFELTGVSAVVSLVLFFPSLAVAIRRMHDVKRSGWWIGSLYLSPLAFLLLVALDIPALLLAVLEFLYLTNIGIVFVFSLKKGIPD